MKKFLIGTTALVAAGFASSAYSAAIEASVNGYMNLGVAFSSEKNADKQASSAFTGTTSVLENDDFHVIRDGEIHFNVKGTSDNGLTFKARIELEAYGNQGDQLDENWASIGGSFGEVMIGGNDTALYQVAGKYGVSYVNGAINYADSANSTTEFTPGSGIEPFGQDDSIGIQYTTPSFSGFKVGVSYQPDSAVRTVDSVGGAISTSGVNARSDNAADAQSTFGKRGPDQYSAALGYDGKFGGVSLGAGLGYMRTGKTENGAIANVTSYEIGQTDTVYAGVDVGYSGFTLSGFYQQAKTKARFVTTTAAGTVSGTYSKTDTFGLGLMYQTGPWTVGGGAAIETAKMDSINSTVDTTNNKGTKIHGTAGVSYALAPGATVAGIIEAGSLKDDTTTIATGVKTSTKTSGVAGAVLFGLKF